MKKEFYALLKKKDKIMQSILHNNNDNWQSSCHTCHNETSMTESELFGDVDSKSSDKEKILKSVPVSNNEGCSREYKAAYLGVKPNVAEDLVSMEELTRGELSFAASWFKSVQAVGQETLEQWKWVCLLCSVL